MTNKNELPKNWVLCRLKDIGQIISGGTPSTKEYSFWGNDIAWITPADLSGHTEKYISKGRKSLTEKGLQNSSAKIIPKGSVLFSSRAPIGYVAIASNDLSTNQGFKNVVPYSGVNSIYLYYYLKNIKELAVENASGTTFKEISGSKFSELPFLLPPLAEQERIVAKIEELFSELDAGLESLKTAQAQLKTYRQAVLKYAFEGKLTNNWRSENKNFADANSLRMTIRTQRENEAKEKGTKLPPFNDNIDTDEDKLFDIPSGWCWVEPEEIASPEKYSIGIGPFGSNLKVSDYKNEGVPLVFVKNITRNDFNLDLKFITEEKFKELIAHSVKPLDIVVTKMGDPPGDCAIYPENRSEAVITSDCLKFRVWEKFASRKFYKYCIDSVLIKKQLGVITKGVAQKKISAGRFKTLLFPLTSLEEQQRIVEEIESRLSVCDKLEETINQSIAHSESLRQSILKQAFEGKLVPQNENDESASVLLERIQEERKTFLAAEKLTKKQIPKNTKSKNMAEDLKSILQLLKEKGEPFDTHSLWQSSEHKEDIDAFYAKVKELIDEEKIEETDRNGKQSFLVLAASK